MAVKVMVAPVIASGEVETGRRSRDPAAPPKPRRRRSSVYDADGNEVFITLMCLKCHKMRPLSQFGLRRMADGAIRNQPWCRPCRSSAGAERPRKIGEAAVAADPSIAEGFPPAAPAEPRPVSASQLAAQVAAAIVWGK
jgi:hypothetical protein